MLASWPKNVDGGVGGVATKVVGANWWAPQALSRRKPQLSVVHDEGLSNGAELGEGHGSGLGRHPVILEFLDSW